MVTVKVNWSGGKDSTCATLLHLEAGHKVKVVSYIPMFTDEIPLILKDHYEFIINTAYEFERMGAEVHIVHGMTYWDFVTHTNIKGKNKGRIRGFACIGRGMCDFKRDSKVKALNTVDIGEYDYTDIGIAYDETSRHGQLTESLRSILVEKEVTEPQARERCEIEGFLSPQYILGKRDGCVLCVNAKEWEREQWFKDYPQAREKVIELQNIVKEQRPDRPPLRGYKYFIE